MLATWDKFHPYILPQVMGCPIELLDQALIERTRHFCERTQVWREDTDPDETEAGEAVYPFYLTADVEAVLWVRLNNSELKAVREIDLPSSMFAEEGEPRRYTLENDNELRFFPVPDGEYPFSARVVLKPKFTSRGIEGFVFDSHARVIASGVLAELMAMPEKTWSNLKMAAVYQERFDRGIAAARVRQYRNVPLRVRPQHF